MSSLFIHYSVSVRQSLICLHFSLTSLICQDRDKCVFATDLGVNMYCGQCFSSSVQIYSLPPPSYSFLCLHQTPSSLSLSLSNTCLPPQSAFSATPDQTHLKPTNPPPATLPDALNNSCCFKIQMKIFFNMLKSLEYTPFPHPFHRTSLLNNRCPGN